MPQVNTGYWVRIENGEVRDVWSSDPDNRPGWRKAVEIFPDVEGKDREVIEGHIFKLDRDPVEIVYQKRPISWEERRDNMISHLDFKIMDAERAKEMNTEEPDNAYDQYRIDEAKKKKDEILPLLNAATSHDDLDKIDI